MNKRFVIGIALLLLVGVASMTRLGRQPNLKADTNQVRQPVVSVSDKESPTHELRFYDPKSFNEGIIRAGEEEKKTDYDILGGIIPHHLLPGYMIADFFNRLSVQKPTTVIIVGPNHYEKGDYLALTSQYDWETPFGVVRPNTKIIADLLERSLVKVDEAVVSNDHSTAGSMSFIKHYLPDAQVVPIVLSAKMSEADSEKLAKSLSRYVSKDTVLVAAVDFSHYLSGERARENDKLTWRAMESFDHQKLLQLNNDYLDSPISIVTLLKAMQEVGATELDLLHNTNSGFMARDNTIKTTSYFSVNFKKP